MKVKKIYTEYQEQPMGLDEALPRFSWLLESKRQGAKPCAYRIRVCRETDGEEMWDSGKVITGCEDSGDGLKAGTGCGDAGDACGAAGDGSAAGVVYGGAKLEPCTGYGIFLQIWDEKGEMTEPASRFETGMMDPDIRAWEGAQWIAAPKDTVMARARGVFRITSTFRFAEGADRAGIVFGAADERLMNGHLNEYGLAGENYIRYEVNGQDPDAPRLDIYRVGYAEEDSDQVPFASVELRRETDAAGSGEAKQWMDAVCSGDEEGNQKPEERENVEGGLLLTRENREQFHTLMIEVSGNQAMAWFDEVLVDSFPAWYGGPGGRVLNPRGINDVLTYPRLNQIPMLRRGFSVDKSLKRARIYATARGIYELYVNGKAMTGSLLAPGLTQYDKRIHYQTYDVTKLLKEGENGLGVILAPGWWSDAQTFTVCNYNYFGDREAFLCRLVLEYEDGSREVIVSEPEQWKYFGDGPYEYASYFMGEQYDARKGWIGKAFSCPGFDDSGWEKPVVYETTVIPEWNAGFARTWPEVNAQEPELIGGYDAPVAVVEERTAKKQIWQEDGSCIYDFEQEMAGVPEITFHEKEGTRILIRYGEMLYPDLPRYGKNVGTLMRENYRDAESTDVYICCGLDGGETWRPRFTFHGFRYLEITGAVNLPDLDEVKALQYSSVTEFQGSFQSSDPVLNRFAENVKWSQLCNFINIPTDCPQRNERMGWAGDTHVFCHTALHHGDLKLFYERNLQAMADLQTKEGRYPEIAPIGGGFGGITYECATIFMAWELYQQYGDKRTLERFYPGMKKYMAYMEDKGLPGWGNPAVIGPLADWLAFQETDPQLMWNAFYYREADLMARIAAVLGMDEDRQQFEALSRRIRAFWNQTFVEAESGKTCTLDGELCDTQTSYALAIEYGVTEKSEQMAAHLARKVRENGYRVGTGFFGTGLLNQALSRHGYGMDAWKMMLQREFPSWLYPVTQGATTIWEHWDSYTTENGFGEYNSMNSFNHYSLGSVLSWMYEWILGIRRLEEYPGYRHFLLKPSARMLEFAQGSVASPYGRIFSGWKKDGSVLHYSCRIPVGATATLVLPDGTKRELESGEYEFSAVLA
ncbi:MAG: family 78 glycoside hydrolase catalytic domain [Lachnospiraceae bacterium]|nr:family 78 glycoside hydrolase catalytic domain [Lachnospiraceae bacterium]